MVGCDDVQEGIELPVLELGVLLAGYSVVPVPVPLADSDAATIAGAAAVLSLAKCAVVVSASREPASWVAAAVAVAAAADTGAAPPPSGRPKYVTADILMPRELFAAPGGFADCVSAAPSAAGVPSARSEAMVFATSGSTTGAPKGCAVTHASLRAFCVGLNAATFVAAPPAAPSVPPSSPGFHREQPPSSAYHPPTPSDAVVFCASPHTFDPSIGTFLASFAAGATVVIASRADTFSRLEACLRASKATHVTCTPSAFATVRCNPARLPALTIVALGGEPTPKAMVQAWASNGLAAAANECTASNMHGTMVACKQRSIAAALAAGASGNPEGGDCNGGSGSGACNAGGIAAADHATAAAAAADCAGCNRGVVLVNLYGSTECCGYQAFGILVPGSETSPRNVSCNGLSSAVDLYLLVEASAIPRLAKGSSAVQSPRIADDGGKSGRDDGESRGSDDGGKEMVLVDATCGATLAALPKGYEAELVLAGPQVEDGAYVGNRGLTDTKFIDHPRLGRCFHTGDVFGVARQATLSRQHPSEHSARGIPSSAISEWRLMFKGRRDGLLKIRGVRVEADSVEASILSAFAPLFTRVTVVPFKSRLVAAVEVDRTGRAWGALPNARAQSSSSSSSSSAPSASASSSGQQQQNEAKQDQAVLMGVRAACLMTLPAPIAPARVITVPNIPVTPTGKASRRGVLEIFREEAEYGSYAEDGRSDTEWHASAGGWAGRVAAAWSAELSLPLNMLRPDSDFNALGGDSLAALRVCQELSANANPADDVDAVAGGAAGGAAVRAGNDGRMAKGDADTWGEALGAFMPGYLVKIGMLNAYAEHIYRHHGGGDAQEKGVEAVHSGAAEPHAAPAGNTTIVSAFGQQPANPAGILATAISCAAGSGAAALLDKLVQLAEAHATASVASDAVKQKQDGLEKALMAASASGAVDCIKILLSEQVSGRPIAAVSGSRVSALHLAVQSGSLDAVRTLVEANPFLLYLVDGDKQTVIHRGARTGAGHKMLGFLLEQFVAGARGSGGRKGGKSGKGSGGGSSGGRSGSGGGGSSTHTPCLDRDKWGRTPLHWAVVNGHTTSVAALLEHNASAAKSLADDSGETPLNVAERRAQCKAQDRPDGLRPSVFGNIATQLGGVAKTVRT